MGSIEFSPPVTLARKQFLVWNLLLLRKEGKRRIKSRYVSRLARKYQISHPLRKTLAEIQEALMDLAVTWKQSLRPKAPELRQSFLLSIANSQDPDDANRAKAAARLLRVEQQRSTARRVKFVLGAAVSPSVTKVECPDGTIEATEAGVTTAIMHNNAQRFRLTESTPPMQELLGLGDTPFARELLQGTAVIPAEVDEVTADFLQSLRLVPTVPLVSTRVTPQDYIGY